MDVYIISNNSIFNKLSNVTDKDLFGLSSTIYLKKPKPWNTAVLTKIIQNTLSLAFYDKNGLEIKKLDDSIKFLFYIDDNTTISDALALISADRYVEPPFVREVQVSALFRHKLIESVEENRDELYNMIHEEREIASKLWNDVRVGTDNFPELSTALQKYKKDLEDINNPIRLLWEVLGELQGFVRSNGNYERKKNWISMLYYLDMPVIIVSAWIYRGVLHQQRIVKFPSFWIYNIKNPQKDTQDIAMFLHSITSYAIHEIRPELKTLVIPQPFAQMRKILEKNGYDPNNIKLDEGYLNLWRKWATVCNSCLKPEPQWMCGQCNQVYFCGKSCQRMETCCINK